jgi:predicted permease
MGMFRHLAAWLRRGRLDDDLREELAQHAAWKAEQLEGEGLPREEARRRAALAIGNVARLREDSRAVWGFPTLDSILQDVHYGLRQIARARGFSAVAIASLAIGIGAGTAVFSLADAVLLRTMAVRDPSRLVVLKWRSGPVFPFSSLNGNGDQNADGLASTSFSRAAFQSFQKEASRHLEVLGFADLYQVTIAVGGISDIGTAHAVSGNYFDVLGVGAAQGRTLGVIDDTAGAPPAAVISDRLWRRRFGGGPGVVGRTIAVNNVPVTVVGVLPAAFHGTGQVGSDPDLFVPLALHARVMPGDDPLDDPNFWWVLMLGRLRPGVSAADARGALDVLLKRTVAAAKPSLHARDYPRIDLLPGGRGQVEDREQMRDPLRTMASVTLAVLLVACANVAGLLLARGRARVRELSIRVAIGAPRRRVVRQLLTEALLLGVIGGLLGIVLAHWLAAALAPALSTALEPGDLLARVDARVLAFAVTLACACAALFGVVPSLRATDLSVGLALQESGRGTIGDRRRRRMSAGLVVGQMALSLVLVAGAALLVRTVRNLQQADLGFDAGHLLLFRLDPAANGDDPGRTTAIYADVLERLRATPGVVSASISSHKLISNSSSVGVVSRLDEDAPQPGSAEMGSFSKTHLAWQLSIDERFFDTMRMRLRRGRVFTPRDAAGASTVVINTALARQLFQSEDVVGRQFNTGTLRQRHAPAEIVGVVEDARYTSVRDEPPPTMYSFYRHPPAMKNAATFEVRTAEAPAAIAAAVRDVVRGIDATLPVYGVMTQTDQIATSLRQERLFARLAALLGTVALLLSAIGLYGLLAYNVARRTPEIGVRMALGAARERVLWMVLRESLALAGLGLLLGVPMALAGTRVLQSMLFGLAARDPATLTGAAAATLVLAVAAGVIPARRASRVDPLVALRAD